MVIANHLYHEGKTLGGGLSFKRRSTWISEIDLFIVKGECISMIKDVNVNQTIPVSDHAPLTATIATDGMTSISTTDLLQRASLLGKQNVKI